MSPEPTAPDHPTTTPGRLRRLLAPLFSRRRKEANEQDALRLPPPSRGMRAFSMIAFFLLGAALSAFLLANPFDLRFLPGGRSDGAASPASASAAAEITVYQCPMHPEVVQDTPGRCPICGMALVEVHPAESGGAAPAGTPEPHDVYQCPMHPEVVQDTPGDCPICGMALVLVESGSPDRGAIASSSAGEIRIDPVQVQNIGVVTAPARIEDIARRSRTVGILDFNAEDVTWVNVKFEGWIEKVEVNYVGEEVRKGQSLFEIYSPELVTTQEEYLRALDYRASLEHDDRPETRRQAESLVRSTRERLAYWDVTDEQVLRLESEREVLRRLTVTSPADGVIAAVMSEALEGMYVRPGMNLYKIVDLSTVWVHADVYEIDIPWIRAGQPAEVSFRNAPEERFRGKVLFLYPEVSSDTRTLRVCVEVPNPRRRLRAGMYADVAIQGPPVRGAVVVPQSAVIRSGERNIVFVALGEGRFEPREVTLGVQGQRDRIQILHGVAAGEDVVTQAQFMLDSESRMQEAIAQFRERAKKQGEQDADPPPSEHRH